MVSNCRAAQLAPLPSPLDQIVYLQQTNAISIAENEVAALVIDNGYAGFPLAHVFER